MPSKYVDYLLSIEHFVCEQKTDTGWSYASMYQLGRQYRFNIRIKNLSDRGKPGRGSNYQKKGVYITQIRLKLTIEGAQFSGGEKNTTDVWLTKPKNFNDFIAPQDAKNFYVEFTWLPAVPLPVKNVSPFIRTTHREIMVMTPGSMTKINID